MHSSYIQAMPVDESQQVQSLLKAITQRLALCQAEGVGETLGRYGQHRFAAQDFHQPEPQTQAVVRYLPEALVGVARFDPEIASGIAAVAPHLRWVQTAAYTDALLGAGFSENYAWCDLIGPQGFFPGDDFIMGLLMLGPHQHYKDHFHPAPELYWPLTLPSLWRKADSAFVPRQQGEIIWHPANVVHATKTLEKPLLAFWVWTRDTATSARLAGS